MVACDRPTVPPMHDATYDADADGLSPRAEGRAAGRRRHVAHGVVRRPAGPGDPHVRRARRRARHVVDGAGVGVVPVRHGARRDVGPRARRARSVGRSGGRPTSKSAHVAAGADRQPAPHADRRAQLRVLQRGPGAHGRARHAPTSAACRPRAWRLRQALRRQRHRVRADDDLVGDRRAHAARAVPRAVRGGRRARPACARS